MSTTLQDVHYQPRRHRLRRTLLERDDGSTYCPADLTSSSVTVRSIGVRSRAAKGTKNSIDPLPHININRSISNMVLPG